MRRLKLLRRGRGVTATLCIRLERTAQLSLPVMATRRTPLIPFLSIYSISLCPHRALLLHTYMNYDISPLQKCAALPSNPIWCIIYCFVKEWESLRAPSFLSAHCGVCSQCLCRGEASCLIGNTQLWFGSLTNEGMYKIHNACRCCKSNKCLMIPE